jgi:hypothetical protein
VSRVFLLASPVLPPPVSERGSAQAWLPESLPAARVQARHRTQPPSTQSHTRSQPSISSSQNSLSGVHRLRTTNHQPPIEIESS